MTSNVGPLEKITITGQNFKQFYDFVPYYGAKLVWHAKLGTCTAGMTGVTFDVIMPKTLDSMMISVSILLNLFQVSFGSC